MQKRCRAVLKSASGYRSQQRTMLAVVKTGKARPEQMGRDIFESAPAVHL
jgi:hypothetical protein